jgi:predicted O-methyltransferase YrrM
VFIDNINNYTNGKQGQIRPLKRTSEKAIEYFKFEDIKIDFLFIDGDHSYEAVKRDFNLYFDFIRPGGTIVLHDYGWSSVRQVIDQYIKPVTRRHNNLSNLWWAKK